MPLHLHRLGGWILDIEQERMQVCPDFDAGEVMSGDRICNLKRWSILDNLAASKTTALP